MATATSVTIKVVVDGKDAGAAIDEVNKSLGQIGVQGRASIQYASDALDKMGGHVTTSLDSVRLLSQEFGLRMPRAIESMLSRMPAVTSALGSIVGVMAGIAAVEIFARVGEEIYKAFDLGGERARAMQKDVDDVNISMRRMSDQTQVQIDKLQEEHAKFEHTPFNGMKLALDEASLAADQFAEKMEAIDNKINKAVADMGNKGGFEGAVSYLFKGDASTHYEQTMLAEHQKRMALADSPEKQGEEINSYIRSLQQRQAQLNDVHFLAKHPNTDFTNERNATALELQYVGREQSQYQADGELTAAQKQKDADDQKKAARADAAAKAKESGEQQLAILHAQHEVIEANLTGQALAAQKLIDDTEELTKRLKLASKAEEITDEVQALNSKYFAEMGEKTVELQNKTALAVRKSQIDAMPESVGKIDAEHWQKVNENNINFTGDDRTAVNIAAAQEAEQKIQALNLEAAKKQQELDKQQSDLHAQILDQETAYAQKAAEAERRVRSQGLAGWVTDYQNSSAAIQAQQAAEQQKLDKMRDDELVKAKGNAADIFQVWTAYGQEKVDLERQANAQIQQQNQEMAHQIADTLEQAYSNPVEFIKRKMQQMFMEILANWIEQTRLFQSLFGQSMGNLPAPGSAPGAGGAGAASASSGGILSRIMMGSAPWSHASAGAAAGGSGSSGSGSSGSGSAGASGGGASAGSVSVGAAIPGSGGMVMTPLGPVPAFDPTSPALQSHFTGGSPAIAGLGGAGAMVAAGSSDGDDADSSGSSGVPSISGSGQPSANPSAGTPSISGNGTTVPAHSGGSLPNFPGNPTGAGSAAMKQAQGIAGAAYGGYEMYQDTRSAFTSGSVGGMFKGALGDAAAGAAIGSIIPGVGTAIGAAVGGAVGLISGAAGLIMGEGGNLAAREYYRKTLFPAIEQQRNGDGQTDFQQAISQVNRTASDGMVYMTQHWGVSAANWVNANYLKKEQDLADSELESRAKGGAAYVGASANQFHSGGPITGFGDFGTSSNEGMIHAMLGETVMNPSASSTHGTILNAMNSGASASDVAKMYLSAGNSSATASAAGGDVHHHYAVNAIDTAGFESFLRRGGARAIVKHTNSFATQYAGDGISG